MARLVLKFGGTSVANVERIRNVARHVQREVEAGNEVAVVVSAMSGKTNELVAWVSEAAESAPASTSRRITTPPNTTPSSPRANSSPPACSPSC